MILSSFCQKNSRKTFFILPSRFLSPPLPRLPASWSALCSHNVSSSFSQDTDPFGFPLNGQYWPVYSLRSVILEPFVLLSYATTAPGPLLPGCRALPDRMMNPSSLHRTDRQRSFDCSRPVDFLTQFLQWLLQQFFTVFKSQSIVLSLSPRMTSSPFLLEEI